MPDLLATYHEILQSIVPFLDCAGRAFVSVPAAADPRRAFALRSRAFRDWFLAQSYSLTGAIPSAHAFAALLRHLEAQAAADPNTRNIHVPLRVDHRGDGPVPEKILLDLADSRGRFVEISAAGWSVNSRSDLVFETFRSTVSLLPPEPSGPAAPNALESLRALLQIEPAAWCRCLAWLLHALHPAAPYPVLILRGPSGSGKSLLARILRALIDPAAALFAPLPASTRELHALARSRWILAFDHISHLSPRLAAGLCRLSTGAAIPCREEDPYNPTEVWIRRPILLTAAGDFTPPPDLARRSLTVTLPEIPEDARQSEAYILSAVQPLLPLALGALCDAVAAILRGPLAPEPQAWTLAAAPALPYPAAAIRQALHDNPSSHIAGARLLDALGSLLKDNPEWSGPAADLARVLPLASNPQALSRHLRTHEAVLAAAGIRLEFRRRHAGSRTIHLRQIASPPPPPPPQAIASKPPALPHEIPPRRAECVTRASQPSEASPAPRRQSQRATLPVSNLRPRRRPKRANPARAKPASHNPRPQPSPPRRRAKRAQPSASEASELQCPSPTSAPAPASQASPAQRQRGQRATLPVSNLRPRAGERSEPRPKPLDFPRAANYR